MLTVHGGRSGRGGGPVASPRGAMDLSSDEASGDEVSAPPALHVLVHEALRVAARTHDGAWVCIRLGQHKRAELGVLGLLQAAGSAHRGTTQEDLDASLLAAKTGLKGGWRKYREAHPEFYFGAAGGCLERLGTNSVWCCAGVTHNGVHTYGKYDTPAAYVLALDARKATRRNPAPAHGKNSVRAVPAEAAPGIQHARVLPSKHNRGRRNGKETNARRRSTGKEKAEKKRKAPVTQPEKGEALVRRIFTHRRSTYACVRVAAPPLI